MFAASLLLHAFFLLLCCMRRASSLWGQAGLGSDVLRNWRRVGKASVLRPQQTKAVVHYIGGFLVGAASPLSYNDLLEHLAERGYLIVSTPIPLVTLLHGEAAASCSKAFVEALTLLELPASLPVLGLSHSLGGKLSAIIASNPSLRQKNDANVYLALNNYSFKQGGKSEAGKQPKEFVPSPEETWRLVETSYSVPQSLLVRFDGDTIDQSREMAASLQRRQSLADLPSIQSRILLLPGDHLTPNRRDKPVFEALSDALDALL